MPSEALTLFLELAAIPSPSGKERAVADAVLRYLADLGLDAEEDDAGTRIGSDMGNILCRLPANAPGTPLFLCAHLDTVPPSGAIEPRLEDGVVRNAAGTILGADDKAAVVAMLEAVRVILQENRPHAGVELVFTPMEEVGLRGAKELDCSRLAARLGYVYDQQGPIGEIVLGAPFHTALYARFHGRAAHSGMSPEEGRSAILAASRAIADFRLGRVDEETSVNVGLIKGGVARNITPEHCEFEAEVRSHEERKLVELLEEMIETITFAASMSDCESETEVVELYRGYRFRADDPPAALARKALERCGFRPSFALTGGGADASVFNARGLPCLNLGNGMQRIHTAEESISLDDLERMVEVTLALVDGARDR
ncbi:MAG: M20/M25/M40 family metallo-hydrolase [Gaiellaceae bacterium]